MQACASYMSSIQLAVLGGAVAHGPLAARVSSDDMSGKSDMLVPATNECTQVGHWMYMSSSRAFIGSWRDQGHWNGEYI